MTACADDEILDEYGVDQDADGTSDPDEHVDDATGSDHNAGYVSVLDDDDDDDDNDDDDDEAGHSLHQRVISDISDDVNVPGTNGTGESKGQHGTDSCFVSRWFVG